MKRLLLLLSYWSYYCRQLYSPGAKEKLMRLIYMSSAWATTQYWQAVSSEQRTLPESWGVGQPKLPSEDMVDLKVKNVWGNGCGG